MAGNSQMSFRLDISCVIILPICTDKSYALGNGRLAMNGPYQDSIRMALTKIALEWPLLTASPSVISVISWQANTDWVSVAHMKSGVPAINIGLDG